MRPQMKHDPDIGHIIVQGIGTDHAKHQYNRAENIIGYTRRICENILAPPRPSPRNIRLARNMPDKNGIDHINILDEEQRARAHAMDTSRAPRITAVVPLPGIPRAMVGIIAPPVAALLAHSGAGNAPSRHPVPNFSGVLEKPFCLVVTNERGNGTSLLPGRIPIKVPINDERIKEVLS